MRLDFVKAFINSTTEPSGSVCLVGRMVTNVEFEAEATPSTDRRGRAPLAGTIPIGPKAKWYQPALG